MRYFFALFFFGLCTSDVVAKFCWVATEWVVPDRSTQYELEDKNLRLDCPFWAHYCLCSPTITSSDRRNCVAFTWEVRVVESNVPNYSIEPLEIGYSETQSVTLAEGGIHSVTLKTSKEVIETYELGASVFGISLGAKSETIGRRELAVQHADIQASVKTSKTSITKTKTVKPKHRLVFYQIHYFLPSHDISWFFEKPETNEDQRIGAPIIEQVSIEEESIDESVEEVPFQLDAGATEDCRDPLVPSCDKNVFSIRKHLHMCVGSLPANKCRIFSSHRHCLKKDVKGLGLHKNYLKVCEEREGIVQRRLRNEQEEFKQKKQKNENRGIEYRKRTSYVGQFLAREGLIDLRKRKEKARQKAREEQIVNPKPSRPLRSNTQTTAKKGGRTEKLRHKTKTTSEV